MPLTPFHLGPGAACKAIVPAHFSFMLFGFSQLVIDVESAYNLLLNRYPVHTFLHSYLGASVILVPVVLAGRPLSQFALRLWNRFTAQAPNNLLFIQPTISWPAAAAGAVVGVYSHVLLDSIMHADMRPLAPFSALNPLLGWIGMPALHLACTAAGILGGAWLYFRRRIARRA